MNQTYIVKAGDTLYGISNQFGVSVTELINLNNVQPTTLQVGQTLKIPNVSGTNPSNTFIYTVKKGDSLYKIAQKYNTTVQAIINLNNLKSINLSIGQTLKIPETYTNGDMELPEFIVYTVKKGDSLYKIASANNVSVDTIIKDNSLNNTVLQIGQVLKLRKTTEEIEECFGPDYNPPVSSNTLTYTVKKGDNLYSIASRYNVSVTSIVNLNNLKNNNLSIGQILKIPITSSTTTYIVKSGDSLYLIAKKFNTTVDNIKKKNNLTSNLLSIGQKLII